MTTNNELDLRLLEAHELDLVNGAGIPVQQQAIFYTAFFSNPVGLVELDLKLAATGRFANPGPIDSPVKVPVFPGWQITPA